jgi:3-deoxy-D-manno-octulosonic-acid transferase
MVQAGFVEKSMRGLYSGLLWVLLPLFGLRLLLRSRRNPAYRRHLRERFFVHEHWTPVPRIWIHAVSLGEVVGIAPLVQRIQKQLPKHRILVTTTTPTGRAELERRYGTHIDIRYLPIDLPHLMRNLVRQVNADALLLFETELWPNLIAAAQRQRMVLLLVNARLSERSFHAYRRLTPMTRGMLERLDGVAARDSVDGSRFHALGVNKRRLRVCGNLKFEQPSGLSGVAALPARQQPPRPTWIAASTHRGEDEIVCATHQRLLSQFPDLLLILVPRHPERFEAVAELCAQHGFRLLRRSEGGAPGQDAQVWLGDSIGELAQWYGHADVAFIGGSLVASGGHNPLEAATHGVAILTGPDTEHFAEIYAELLDRKGAIAVRDGNHMGQTLEALLTDPQQRQILGRQARSMLEGNRGATECICNWLQELLAARGAAGLPAGMKSD